MGPRPISGFFYCIEAGIPFFFYGKDIEYYSDGSRKKLEGWKKGKLKYSDISMQKYYSKKEISKIRMIMNKFKKIQDTVTAKQKEIVEEHLGINSNITRTQIRQIFIKSLFLNLFNVLKIYYFAILKRKFKK